MISGECLYYRAPVKLVNLTPHEVMVFHSDGERYIIPPSGQIARARSEFIPDEPVSIFDSVRCEYGRVTGLPESEEGIIFIVSGLVLNVLAGSRPDCVAPDTGPSAVRDEQGNIVGVRRFLKGGEG